VDPLREAVEAHATAEAAVQLAAEQLKGPIPGIDGESPLDELRMGVV
jgi:hypothetical protein